MQSDYASSIGPRATSPTFLRTGCHLFAPAFLGSCCKFPSRISEPEAIFSSIILIDGKSILSIARNQFRTGNSTGFKAEAFQPNVPPSNSQRGGKLVKLPFPEFYPETLRGSVSRGNGKFSKAETAIISLPS